MNPYEDELQKNVEKGETSIGDGLDVKAYQAVFRALKKDPHYQLPSTFAEKVAARIIARQHEKVSKDYLWFGAGIVFLIISFVGTLIYTGFRLDLKFAFGFLAVMSDYKGLAVFGIVFIFLLNWLDKKLVKEKQFQHRA
jgi:preprotein translocase subunit SecF